MLADNQTIQTITRRTLLKGLSLAFVPKVQNALPIPSAPKPKFWFGDRVSYIWIDDNGNPQKEFGKVVGACWNPLKKHWEYSVIWLSSTLYTGKNSGLFCGGGETYPSFDQELIYEEEIQRAYSEVKLCNV